jgi:hypothetical protein
MSYADSLGSNKDIDSFRTSFYKSDEMIQAFREVGIEYRNRQWDDDYEEFQRKTKRTPEKERIKSIRNLKRLIVPATATSKEESFIVHDMQEVAKDALGNELTAYRSNLGCFHKVKVKRQIKIDEETGDKIPVVIGIEELQTCYSIPFNKENISKIEKYITSNTAFTIQKLEGTHRRTTIDSFDDWKNVEPKYLVRFGHKPSDWEKTVFANELQGKYETYHPPANAGPQYR